MVQWQECCDCLAVKEIMVKAGARAFALIYSHPAERSYDESFELINRTDEQCCQERSRVMFPDDARFGVNVSLDGVMKFHKRRNALRRP